jgi:hypothetical protein
MQSKNLFFLTLAEARGNNRSAVGIIKKAMAHEARTPKIIETTTRDHLPIIRSHIIATTPPVTFKNVMGNKNNVVTISI